MKIYHGGLLRRAGFLYSVLEEDIIIGRFFPFPWKFLFKRSDTELVRGAEKLGEVKYRMRPGYGTLALPLTFDEITRQPNPRARIIAGWVSLTEEIQFGPGVGPDEAGGMLYESNPARVRGDEAFSLPWKEFRMRRESGQRWWAALARDLQIQYP